MSATRAFAAIGLLSLLWCIDAEAGWVRRYEKIDRGHSGAIAALPNGRALVYASGFQHTLFTIDEKGDVLAARKLDSYVSFVTTGTAGEIFVGTSDLFAVNASRGMTASLWIARLNADLSVKWSRTLKPLLAYRSAFRILGTSVTSDGGLLLGGYVDEASFVLKLRATGELEWKMFVDPSDLDRIHAVHATRDGGAICAGESRRSPWLLKLDRNGKVVWRRTYSMRGVLKSVLETREGHILAAGSLEKTAMVMQTSANGAARWQKRIHGLRDVLEIGAAASSFVIAGIDERVKIHLVEMKADGAVGWRKRFDPPSPLSLSVPTASHFAITPEAIHFAPGLSSPDTGGSIHAFRLDPRTMSGCNWFVNAPAVAAVDVSLSAEPYEIETGDLPLQVASHTIVLKPDSLTSAGVSCTAQNAASAPAPAPAPKAKLSSFRGDSEERARKRGYRDLLAAKNYDKLDELAAKFRRERRRHDPMWWELGHFYDALTSDDAVTEEQRHARLRAWVAARPKSTAARIALTNALHDAAWRRRGAGFSDTVTPQGQAGYEELIDEATRVLKTLAGKADEDAYMWTTLIEIAHQTGSGDVREIARHAAAKGHEDPRLYQTAASYLHRKWGGSGSKYRAFTEEAARLTSSTFGEGIYTWLAYQAMINVEPEEYAKDYAFDWQRMKRGFEDVIRLNPQWVPSYHRYARVASQFEDRTTARALFQKPELNWYEGAEQMWRGNRQEYDSAREWALRKPVEPFIESAPETIKASAWKPVSLPARAGDRKHWPQIVMESELTTDSKYRLNAFLVQSANGPVLVSTVPPNDGRPDTVNDVLDTWRRTRNWTIWADAKRTAKIEVAGLSSANVPNRQQSVVLTLKPTGAKPAVHVLKAAPREQTIPSRRLYIVGCRWTNARCEQIVAEGNRGSEDRSGSYRNMHISLYERHDENTFVGGPVLDEDGYVIGVAKGPAQASMPYVAQIIAVEYLSDILSATVATPLPLSPPVAKAATAPVARPLPNVPFAKWPIVMQNVIVQDTKTNRRTSSFLVRTPGRAVAISVLPEVPFGESAPPFTKWRMWSPQQPQTMLNVETMQSQRRDSVHRGVALRLAEVNSLPVQALQPNLYPQPGRCYVVGCEWSAGKCVQTIVEGTIPEMMLNMSTFSIGFRTELANDALVGAAVLDERGEVIGVLIGPNRINNADFTTIRYGERITSVLPRRR